MTNIVVSMWLEDRDVPLVFDSVHPDCAQDLSDIVAQGGVNPRRTYHVVSTRQQQGVYEAFVSRVRAMSFVYQNDPHEDHRVH